MSEQHWIDGAPVQPIEPEVAPTDLERRSRRRSAIRIALVLWAVVWLAAGAGATADEASSVGTAETVAASLFFAATSLGPLLSHIWWSRRHPIGSTSANAPTVGAPRSELLTRLDHVGDAANELRSFGWASNADLDAIGERSRRLEALVIADEAAIARGGTPSPTVAAEVDQLRDRVLGLLDVAIDSAAVAPGDRDLDQRLQLQLDALRARGQAIDELEGRRAPEA